MCVSCWLDSVWNGWWYTFFTSNPRIFSRILGSKYLTSAKKTIEKCSTNTFFKQLVISDSLKSCLIFLRSEHELLVNWLLLKKVYIHNAERMKYYNLGHNILALLSKLRKYWKIRSDKKFSIFFNFDGRWKSFDLRDLLS